MKLKVSIRDVKWKKVSLLIKENKIPWVIYWKHMQDALSIQFERNEFIKLFKISWETTPINVVSDNMDQLALVHYIQKNPITDRIIHVDFLAVSKDEKVKAEVPVILVWESKIEKDKLWQVNLIKDFIEIEAFPLDIPHEIKIDISSIENINDVIFIRDLKLWDKVEIKENIDIPIVNVLLFQEEDEEETKQVVEWDDATKESTDWNQTDKDKKEDSKK